MYNKNVIKAVIIIMTTWLILVTLLACKTKYIAIPKIHKEFFHKTDSFFRVDTVKEKIFMTIKEVDSAQLAALGIQLRKIQSAYLIERIRNQERSKTIFSHKIDTILKTDTISIPFPVEKKLTSWQKIKMKLGGIAIIATLIAACFVILRLVNRSATTF